MQVVTLVFLIIFVVVDMVKFFKSNTRNKEAGDSQAEDAKQFPGFQFEYNNSVNKFTLPDWMEEFFKNQPIATHNKTLADPNEKFIVLTCHKYKGTFDEACGGLSDRLRYLPQFIWLAYRTGRKLLIKHSTPHPLEEFLIPPEGGLDWRLPDKYVQHEWDTYANRSWGDYRKQRRIAWPSVIGNWNETRFIFVNSNVAKFVPVPEIHEEYEWPGIFRRMFKPSKALGKAIDTLAKKSGLVPGAYGGAHIRARFPVGQDKIKWKSNLEHHGVDMMDNVTQQLVKKLGENAVKCVTRIMPETKYVYVASDTNELIQYLLEESGSTRLRWNDAERENKTSAGENDVKIVVRPDYNVSSLHYTQRNFPGLNGTAPPEAYFQIFIDLWMLAHTKCLSQDVGGFGHFASMLSGNHLTCRAKHRDYISVILDSCPTPNELKIEKLKKMRV